MLLPLPYKKAIFLSYKKELNSLRLEINSFGKKLDPDSLSRAQALSKTYEEQYVMPFSVNILGKLLFLFDIQLDAVGSSVSGAKSQDFRL